MNRLMKRMVMYLMAMSILLPIWFMEVQATVEHEDPKRVISVVFDNSGSMYVGDEDGIRVWCRATYAMEALATMMNPGDEMLIYPMNPIQLGKTEGNGTYTYDNPLHIKQSEAAKIREIYTPVAGDTHIETISAACGGLMNATADEKWLIVLTDGDEFYKNKAALGSNTIKELESVLSECASQVDVMYLGIGPKVVNGINVTGTYRYIEKTAKDTNKVLENLTDMCNTIFGRNILPVIEDKISMDVTIKRLILFAQGDNVSNVVLTGQADIASNDLQYSTYGAGNSSKQKPDTSLKGVMRTYGEFDAGTYDVANAGKAGSVAVYYEPDVDLKVTMWNAEGVEVDPNLPQYPGDYTIAYCMVDRDGNETTSPLLGDVKYEIAYKVNGQEQVKESDRAGEFKVSLMPDDTFDAEFKVTYLNNYTIRRSGSQLGWPDGGFTVGAPPAGVLSISLDGVNKEYGLVDFANGQKARLSGVYEGEPVAGEMLDRMTITTEMTKGSLAGELKRDEEGYYIDLTVADPSADVKEGMYTIQIHAIYTTEHGQNSNQAAVTESFRLVDNSSTLNMRLDVKQDYYEIGKLDQGQPIRVKLDMGGQPLSAEQMETVDLQCDAKGLQFFLEKLPEESAIDVRIVSKPKPDTGSHRISFNAVGKNELGKEVTDKASTSVQIRSLPQWLRLLLWMLAILIPIVLIALFMNMKVLPKKAGSTGTVYNVDGDEVAGRADVNLRGAGTKKGSIEVVSPRYAMAPEAKCGLVMTVEAVSPRRVSSNKRKMRVLDVKEIGKSGMLSYKIGGNSFTLDPNTGKFTKAGMKEGNFKPFEIGNNTPISIIKSVDNGPSVNFGTKIFLPKKK